MANIDMELIIKISKNLGDTEDVKKLINNTIDVIKWSKENIPNEFECNKFLNNNFIQCVNVLKNTN